MSSIKEYLTGDHRRCDELFAIMEDKAATSIEDAKEAVGEFIKETERHFQLEERIMFPKFEQKTGMVQGPTAVMRHEHSQMRALMKQMQESIEVNNKDRFFGTCETMMILMQQHNMKEEQMLYTIAQQHLSAQSQLIVEMMESMIAE